MAHGKNQFTVFGSSHFSQYHKCDITIDGTKYHSAQQYMIHQKALLFDETKLAAEVLKTASASECSKTLDSMKINRAKVEEWKSSCHDIIYRGNLAKFEQNASLKEKLLQTVGTTLVYADLKDELLGVGISEKNKDAHDPKKWRGKNLLGDVLTEIRDSFLKDIEWTTGSPCRARWSEDGKLYDATVVSKHPDNRTCTVRYNKYSSEEILPLLSLLPVSSGGQPAGGQFATPRSTQSHAAKRKDRSDEDWDKEAMTPTKMRSGASRMEEHTKFTFFWNGTDILSQWYIAKFQVENIWYNCAEQYMMHQKAVFFKDTAKAEEIMAAKRPVHQKELGRKVHGFNDDEWNLVCKDVVKKGNMAKFSQNPKLGKYLLATGRTILAEASPYDRKWGIGMSADDPRARNQSEWRGDNLLGQVLMEVREELSQRSDTLFDASSESDNGAEDAEEGYTLFWRSLSPFSQWHPAFFTIGGIEYNCAEQYMMYQKAVFFNDEVCAREVLYETDPRRQKQIAKKVQNFDETRWNEVSKKFVREGSMGKYSQNPDLMKELFATANTVLVEASADDTRWGIGTTKDDRNSWSRRTWRGENWLGDILTDVRDELMSKEKNVDMSNRICRAFDGNSYRTFSLPQSPFHLFYPASIEVGGVRFHSAGHHMVYSLAAAAGSQKYADSARELVDGKPLIPILHSLLADIDPWSQDLNNSLLNVNHVKFEQHPDLMQKLIDTVEDQIVYAGTERHLGVDFELQIYNCAEKENKLGKVLMEIRQTILKSSPPPVKFHQRFVRHDDGRRRRGNGDGSGSTPRSTPKGTGRREDSQWSNASTPGSTPKGTYRQRNDDHLDSANSFHSASSETEWRGRDDNRGTTNSHQSSSKGSDRRRNDDRHCSASSNQGASVGSDRRGNDDYWDNYSTPRNSGSSRGEKSRVGDGNNDSGKKTESPIGDARSGQSPKNMITDEQKQLPKNDVVFSDSSSPFHLWYPAKVEIDGIIFDCIGQCLIHKAARDLIKKQKLVDHVMETCDEGNYLFVKKKCDAKCEQYAWSYFVEENLARLNEQKFRQHRDLRRLLVETNDSRILFASSDDNILGTGCSKEGMTKINKFRGKNYLGKNLIELRKELSKEEHDLVVELQQRPTKSDPPENNRGDCGTENNRGGDCGTESIIGECDFESRTSERGCEKQRSEHEIESKSERDIESKLKDKSKRIKGGRKNKNKKIEPTDSHISNRTKSSKIVFQQSTPVSSDTDQLPCEQTNNEHLTKTATSASLETTLKDCDKSDVMVIVIETSSTTREDQNEMKTVTKEDDVEQNEVRTVTQEVDVNTDQVKTVTQESGVELDQVKVNVREDEVKVDNREFEVQRDEVKTVTEVIDAEQKEMESATQEVDAKEDEMMTVIQQINVTEESTNIPDAVELSDNSTSSSYVPNSSQEVDIGDETLVCSLKQMNIVANSSQFESCNDVPDEEAGTKYDGDCHSSSHTFSSVEAGNQPTSNTESSGSEMSLLDTEGHTYRVDEQIPGLVESTSFEDAAMTMDLSCRDSLQCRLTTVDIADENEVGFGAEDSDILGSAMTINKTDFLQSAGAEVLIKS